MVGAAQKKVVGDSRNSGAEMLPDRSASTAMNHDHNLSIKVRLEPLHARRKTRDLLGVGTGRWNWLARDGKATYSARDRVLATCAGILCARRGEPGCARVLRAVLRAVLRTVL